jgi:hypothetical protein
MHLVADHRPAECGIGLLPARQRVVRDSGGADGAAVQQVAHARHDHRVGDDRVGLVNLVQRDVLELQPPRTRALALFHHDGKRRDRKDLAGHRDLVALVAQCLAEDSLALAESVHLRGVEERHTQGACAADDLARGAGGVTVAVAPLARSELPGAQPDPTDPADTVDVQILHLAYGTD